MASALAEDLQQNIREAVDDGRQGVEARRGVDHAERLAPRHAIQIDASGIEACDHGQRDLTGRLVRGLDVHVGPDLAQRPGHRAVLVDGQVSGQADAIARDPHRLEALVGQTHRRRQVEAEFSQPLLDGDDRLRERGFNEYMTAAARCQVCGVERTEATERDLPANGAMMRGERLGTALSARGGWIPRT